MSKLIFNPEKDMKELLDYGFEYDDTSGQYTLKYRNPTSGGVIKITVNSWNKKVRGYAHIDDYEFTNLLCIYYKLIKANLIIDEEEMNGENCC